MNVIIYTVITNVTKVLRIKNETFDALINTAKWTDTMDDIINKLLIQSKKAERYKNKMSQDSGRQTIPCDRIGDK
jgi:hypothetical protein